MQSYTNCTLKSLGLVTNKIAFYININDSFTFNLTHCGLVTPYDDKELGQYWLR